MGEMGTRIVAGLLGSVVFLGTYFGNYQLFIVLLGVIYGYTLVFEWPLLARGNNAFLWLLTPLYPTIPFVCLVYLTIAFRTHDPLVPLYPFIVAWVADTASYFVGRAFGRHKVCPSISPNKSWEGLFGGFCAVFIANTVVLVQASHILSASIALLLTVSAFLGDVFVSYFKRRVDLKDTGDIIPGHGGVLDRFDSVLFVAVIVTVLVWF